MKKIKHISLVAVILIFTITVFSGCGKSIDRIKSTTAKEAIELFNKYNKEGNIEEMIKLYSDAYVDYVGYTEDQIYKIIESNRKNIEIRNSEIISVDDVEEGVKKAVIAITSVYDKEEVTEEYTYAILKEGDGWAISPDGIIKSISFDVPMSKDNELNLNLVKEAIQFDGAIVKINVYNDTKNEFVFGNEESKTEVVVETTEGTYKSTLDETVVVPKRSKSYFMAKIEDVKGDIKRVEVTSVFDADEDQKPIESTKRDITVYSK